MKLDHILLYLDGPVAPSFVLSVLDILSVKAISDDGFSRPVQPTTHTMSLLLSLGPQKAINLCFGSTVRTYGPGLCFSHAREWLNG